MTISAHSKIRLTAVLLAAAAILSALLSGCGSKEQQKEKRAAKYASANSYLSSALSHITGEPEGIVNLVPPGMCPGHFDISPSQVKELFNCRILFLFDFQGNIEDSVQRISQRGLKLKKLKAQGGMCLPKTYENIISQLCRLLAEDSPETAEMYKLRKTKISEQIEKFSADTLNSFKEAGLQGKRVICSEHQEAFCKWLGLDVIASFSGRDTVTPAQINECLKSAEGRQIDFVIANRQEGTKLAEAIAERVGARTAVFSNFPSPDAGGLSYFAMVENNIRSITEAGK
ncbi:metal ABC transporter substrate-binding protein [Sedimentisphaera salicampi]|uniref:ABC-type Zn2+ transport system, periplasmic component/surface adhesin n=1 Tax=Sedimentisphaera salicampi TaxID=1941349 RepID=A0A1W6LL77_9BACT|nr:metal ABC transporter substrate-binding protein [Sedimentisphaera salicampi]ARN56506.1 ABC-type Zn2+ transport system, periplasmic component/surface adhesin [Sedimentisphaera salicampi]OXU15389.1 ABC-type Zn2+ transport system, periplasmic component/surface adhesin [Sedimentisphaera salicampi]